MNGNSIETKIVQAIQEVIRPRGNDFIPLHVPTFIGNEKDYVSECIETGWVSSVGGFVDKFEKELSSFCGVEKAVATSNGTSALHICLLLAGVKPQDEVLIPTMTFVATANAVSYTGAIPHFADSEKKTLGLHPEKLSDHLDQIAELRADGCYNHKTGRRIAAIIPMHTFGHPVRIKDLLEVADKWSIPVVEDAAESLGSYYQGKHTGSFGLLSAVSFNGNKIITAGGGGAILTNDPALAKRAKHLTTTAKCSHPWNYIHDEIGYNYRMPNLNAALVLAQLEQMPKFLEHKRKLAQRYSERFADVQGVDYVKEPKDCKSNYWLNTLLLQTAYEKRSSTVLETLNNAGLMARPVWTPMHRLPMYAKSPRMNLDIAESLASRLINIPSSFGL